MSKAYPIAIAVSLIYLVLYVILGVTGVLFYLETDAEPIGSISGWCERVTAGIFRENANALSNLGFMIAGLLMFKKLTNDEATNSSKNNFTSLNKLSVLYAGAAIYLGPGSMLMHGTHTEWGGWADNFCLLYT